MPEKGFSLSLTSLEKNRIYESRVFHVIFVIRRVLFPNIISNYNSIIDTNYIIYELYTRYGRK